jgi:formylglycine-generating enzyme required for sulfatase activity
MMHRIKLVAVFAAPIAIALIAVLVMNRFRYEKVTMQSGVNPVDGVTLVWVPAGDCVLGYRVPAGGAYSSPADAKYPQQVYLDGYWICRDEVTVRQYRAYCVATHCAMPAEAPPWGWQDDLPMTNVTWSEANAYARYAGGNLPTAAQWEKAAVGPSGQWYPWGNEFGNKPMAITANWSEDYKAHPEPAGTCPSDTSPYGARDMFGNVMEWCADWYVTGDPVWARRNPSGPAIGTEKIYHGLAYCYGKGEVISDVWKDCNSAPPTRRGEEMGFRYVINRAVL